MRDNRTELGQTVGKAVRERPLGVALAALGVAWLFFGPKSPPDKHRERYRRREPDTRDLRTGPPARPPVPLGGLRPRVLPLHRPRARCRTRHVPVARAAEPLRRPVWKVEGRHLRRPLPREDGRYPHRLRHPRHLGVRLYLRATRRSRGRRLRKVRRQSPSLAPVRPRRALIRSAAPSRRRRRPLRPASPPRQRVRPRERGRWIRTEHRKPGLPVSARRRPSRRQDRRTPTGAKPAAPGTTTSGGASTHPADKDDRKT